MYNGIDFWDLNSLTISELEEIINIKKAFSISEDEALKRWAKQNPGRVKHLGSLNKTGEIEVNVISKDGVKEIKGMEAINHMIKSVINKKLGTKDERD